MNPDEENSPDPLILQDESPARLQILDALQSVLEKTGLSQGISGILTTIIGMIGLLILSVAANYLAKKVILVLVRKLVSRSRTKIDDALVKWRVFHKLSHFAPAMVIYTFSPQVLARYPHWVAFFHGAAVIYMYAMAVMVVDSALNAFLDIYRTFPSSKETPIKGSVQVSKIVVYCVGGILMISVMVGKSPTILLSGLGAMTAILMLVFKDPILGFVAGVQLTSNKMVSVGDWIEMPKHNADGDVLEVALTTVKVQNWDKTITTIPTYALISDSFKNWRGMSESGGRRIKRFVNVDMQTIRFCTEEMLERFSRIKFISEYIETKKRELEQFNKSLDVDLAMLANGRRLTNIGTFRAYVVAYLKNHPMINTEMTFLIRQLLPTPHGLPIEIYVFCRDQVWANYEAIQADIFDHILAVMTEFDLQVFQNPSGADFRKIIPEKIAS